MYHPDLCEGKRWKCCNDPSSNTRGCKPCTYAPLHEATHSLLAERDRPLAQLCATRLTLLWVVGVGLVLRDKVELIVGWSQQHLAGKMSEE